MFARPFARPAPTLTPFPARPGQFWLCMEGISSVLGLFVFRAAGELVAVHIIVTCTIEMRLMILLGLVICAITPK